MSEKDQSNSPLGRAAGALGDHPHRVNLGILVVSTVVCAVLAMLRPALLKALSTDGVELSLGMLSVAGIMAGFVGVIVVFGLQASAPVFVTFRLQSGATLGRNWTALIGTGFLAAGMSMFAAIGYSLDRWTEAGGLLLASMGLALHCAIRMLWLVKLLITAVRIDDQTTSERAHRRKSAAETYGSRD